MYEPEERRRSFTSFLVPLGGIVVSAAIIVGVVFGLGLIGGDDDPEETVAVEPTPAPTATPAGSPEELILGQYVRQTLEQEYAGDCSTAGVGQQGPAETPAPGETAQPQPASGLCSQHRGEREGVQAYSLGQPLADHTRWAFLQESGGNWQVIHSVEITSETQAVPGIPWPLQPNVEVVVAVGDCLNVREGPSLEQPAVDCIPDGTTIVLAPGPADADGFEWWQIDGRAGWVVSDYLRYPDAVE